MKPPPSLIALPLLVALGLAGCADRGHPPRQDSGPDGGNARPSAAPVFSPNGEPLSGGALGQPSCALAMDYWFLRADTDRDERLGREEFLADARAQFARMDVDHVGYLTSDALRRYRAPFQKETRPRGIPDPVASADRNLDFKVTEPELLQRAGGVFEQMDAARKDFLDRADLAAYCARQAKPNRAEPGGRPSGGVRFRQSVKPGAGPPGGTASG